MDRRLSAPLSISSNGKTSSNRDRTVIRHGINASGKVFEYGQESIR